MVTMECGYSFAKVLLSTEQSLLVFMLVAGYTPQYEY